MSAISLLALAALAVIPDGQYEQGCQAGYRRAEIIAGENAVYVEKNFADPFCRELSLEIRSYGLLTYGEAVPRPAGAAAIDFLFQRVTLTPKQEWVARLYRDRRLCGLSEWSVGQETEITGRSCDFFGVGRFSPVPEGGAVRYGVYRQEQNGNLYMGKLRPERDGLTPERRPQELDPFPYERRP